MLLRHLMLSPDEQSQLQIAISAIKRRASEALSITKNSWQAIAFVDTLHRNMDVVIVTSDSTTPAPECKPGCTYCCHARVEVSDPEALYIAWHLHHLPAARKAPLIERLHLKAAEFDGAGRAEADTSKSQPCAFLQDGLCSIYSIRPSVCRKAHSLSVKACETQANKIPQNLTRVVQCEALMAGTNEAYRSVGLPASGHELSAAVLAALAGNAEEAWYQGKPLLPDSTE
jgi:Fe-S-cluster containining protein